MKYHQRQANTRKNQATQEQIQGKHRKISPIYLKSSCSNYKEYNIEDERTKEVKKLQSQSRENGHHLEAVPSLSSYSRNNRTLRLYNVQEVLFELSIMVVVAGCFALVVFGKTLLKTSNGDVYL